VAYEMVKKMYPDKGDDYILMLPSKEFRINVYRVRESLQRVRETVIDYTRYGIIDITDEIKNYSTDQIIEDGLNNLGLYNYHVPLRLSKYNFYYTEDICTLFYYHNRLVGYDLEMCI
jgi:glycerol-3-phosphate O-acyltransferase